MITTVVNLRNDVYDEYIGRRNPALGLATTYGRDGYFGNPFHLQDESERAYVVQQYEKYFYDRIEKDLEFKRRILELRGKRLGCFCKPRLCHGDIIADYLNNLVQ